jgi:hypothetical protein
MVELAQNVQQPITQEVLSKSFLRTEAGGGSGGIIPGHTVQGGVKSIHNQPHFVKEHFPTYNGLGTVKPVTVASNSIKALGNKSLYPLKADNSPVYAFGDPNKEVFLEKTGNSAKFYFKVGNGSSAEFHELSKGLSLENQKKELNLLATSFVRPLTQTEYADYVKLLKINERPYPKNKEIEGKMSSSNLNLDNIREQLALNVSNG